MEKTMKWDIQDSKSLKTEKGRRDFLKHTLKEYGDDPEFIAACLGEVAKARGMDKVAEATGFSKQGLYKSMRVGGNPSFAMVMGVAHALGVELRMA